MARITIADLPPLETIPQEELEQIFGAGRFRPSFEAMEERQLMAGGLTASLTGSFLRLQDTQTGDSIHVRQLNGLLSVDGIAIQTGAGSQASIAVSALSQVEIRTPAGHDQIWLGDVGHPLGRSVNLEEGGAGDTLVTPGVPGGVTLANSATKAVVTSDGSVFVLYANGTLVRSQTSSGNATTVATNVVSVTVDGAGNLYSLGSDHVVRQYQGPSSWLQISTPFLSAIGVDGSGTLFGYSASYHAVCQYLGTPNQWQTISNSPAAGMAVDGTGTLYYLSTAGSVYSYNDNINSANPWTQVCSPILSAIAVDKTGTLFGYSASYHAVCQYLGTPNQWQTISNSPAAGMAVDGTGTLYYLSSAGSVYSYNDSINSANPWTQVCSPILSAIAVDGAGLLFGYSASYHAVCQYLGTPNQWQTISNSPAAGMAVDGTGTLYYLSTAGSVYSYNDSINSANPWTQVCSPILSAIAVDGAGLLFGYSASRHAVCQYLGTPNQWATISNSPAAGMAVDGTGTLYYLSSAGSVYSYNDSINSANPWTQVCSPILSAIAVDGAGLLFGYSASRHAVCQYLGTPNQWATISNSPAAGMAVDGTGTLYYLSSAGSVYSYNDSINSANPWTQVCSPILSAIAVDGAGLLFGYSASYHAVCQYLGTPNQWQTISNSPAAGMAVDGTGTLYYLSTAGSVYSYNDNINSANPWTQVCSPILSAIAVDKTGTLFGYSASYHAVCQYLGTPNQWQTISNSPAAGMAVDGTGTLYYLSTAGSVYSYNDSINSANPWTQVCSPILSAIAVDGAGLLFGYSASRHAVCQYLGTPNQWQTISNSPAAGMAVDGTGTLYYLSSAGSVYSYNDSINSANPWTQVCSPILSAIAVDGAGLLFGYSASYHAVCQYLGTPNQWQTISNSPAAGMAVDGTGTLYYLSTAGSVYSYNDNINSANPWTQVCSPILSAIAVDGAGLLFGYSASRQAVCQYLGTPNQWQTISGSPAAGMVVDGTGTLYYLSTSGVVYSYNDSINSANPWQTYGTSGVIASDGSIWFLGTTTVDKAGDRAIYKISNGQVTPMPGSAARLSLIGGQVTATSANGATGATQLANGTFVTGQGGSLSISTSTGNIVVLPNSSFALLPDGRLSLQVGSWLTATLGLSYASSGTVTLSFSDVTLNTPAFFGKFVSQVLADVGSLANALSPLTRTVVTLPPSLGGGSLTAADLLCDLLKLRNETDWADKVEKLATLQTTLQNLSSLNFNLGRVKLGDFTVTAQAPGGKVTFPTVGLPSLSLPPELSGLVQQVLPEGLQLPALSDMSQFLALLSGDPKVTVAKYTLPGMDLPIGDVSATLASLPVAGAVSVEGKLEADFRAHLGGSISLTASGQVSGDLTLTLHGDVGLAVELAVGTAGFDVGGYAVFAGLGFDSQASVGPGGYSAPPPTVSPTFHSGWVGPDFDLQGVINGLSSAGQRLGDAIANGGQQVSNAMAKAAALESDVINHATQVASDTAASVDPTNPDNLNRWAHDIGF